MPDQPMQPSRGPIITERAQRWLDGGYENPDDYFTECRAINEPLAIMQVDALLNRAAELRSQKQGIVERAKVPFKILVENAQSYYDTKRLQR